jgi:hypothetical protein
LRADICEKYGALDRTLVDGVQQINLPAKQLKYIFIAVMFYMGLKMCGVFAWLNLPI